VPYHPIDDPTKLRRVVEATLLLEANLELPALLRHVIDEARSMTRARYAALGVLNEDRTDLIEFITAGMTPEEQGAIGARPTGHGVLGLLISDPRPLRLAEVATHADSVGFPPNHPPMTSFLGVPIKVRNEVYGNLYLADRVESPEFSPDDVAVAEALALAAGIAIENERLHQQVQRGAIYEDRDRLARDLHDTVIQKLFGVGLTLQSMAGTAPGEMAEVLTYAVAEIDRVIGGIRSTIYQLGMNGEDRGTRDRIISLLRELRAVVGFDVPVSFDGPVDTAISDDVSAHLMATISESVTNVGRHAHAAHAMVTVRVAEGLCTLTVRDDGVGIDESTRSRTGGLGLTNLQRRAEKLEGTFRLENAEGGGALATWQVPLHL
jgi:signal transduction histidine kinase